MPAQIDTLTWDFDVNDIELGKAVERTQDAICCS